MYRYIAFSLHYIVDQWYTYHELKYVVLGLCGWLWSACVQSELVIMIMDICGPCREINIVVIRFSTWNSAEKRASATPQLQHNGNSVGRTGVAEWTSYREYIIYYKCIMTAHIADKTVQLADNMDNICIYWCVQLRVGVVDCIIIIRRMFYAMSSVIDCLISLHECIESGLIMVEEYLVEHDAIQ